MDTRATFTERLNKLTANQDAIAAAALKKDFELAAILYHYDIEKRTSEIKAEVMRLLISKLEQAILLPNGLCNIDEFQRSISPMLNKLSEEFLASQEEFYKYRKGYDYFVGDKTVFLTNELAKELLEDWRRKIDEIIRNQTQDLQRSISLMTQSQIVSLWKMKHEAEETLLEQLHSNSYEVNMEKEDRREETEKKLKSFESQKTQLKSEDSITLHHLIRIASATKVKTRLIKCNKKQINETDADGNTPLHIACIYGKPALTSLLLSAGADPFVKDKHGYLPIYNAVKTGDEECFQVLVSYVTKRFNHAKDMLNARGEFDRSLLHAAAFSGRPNIAKQLLLIGLDIDAKTNDKEGSQPQTALQTVCSLDAYRLTREHLKVVDILLHFSADPSCTNCLGETALHEAAILGHIEVLKIFEKYNLYAEEEICLQAFEKAKRRDNQDELLFWLPRLLKYKEKSLMTEYRQQGKTNMEIAVDKSRALAEYRETLIKEFNSERKNKAPMRPLATKSPSGGGIFAAINSAPFASPITRLEGSSAPSLN